MNLKRFWTSSGRKWDCRKARRDHFNGAYRLRLCFGKSIDARNFGYEVSFTPVRPRVQTVGVEVGSQDSLWDGNVRAIFLGGKSHGSVAFSNSCISGGDIILGKSKAIKSKEHERRGDERNLSEARRRRESFNENQRKAERNRARDKKLIHNSWLSDKCFPS